jgi:hypothetical protein
MSDTFNQIIYTINNVIIAIGFAGNILSFIIFSRKAFKNNSISTYFRAFSVMVSFTMFQFAINVGILALNKDISAQSDVVCKLLYYTWPVYDSSAAWILMVFSIDKMLNMNKKSIPTIKKRWFQWSVVALIVFIQAILYIGVPFDIKKIEIFPGYYLCLVTNLSFFSAFSIMYLLGSSFLPFIVMMITSLVTIRLLIKSRGTMQLVGITERQRRSRDTRYAISSLTFNFFFITFKMPFLVAYMILAFTSTVDIYYINVSEVLFFINMSSNFFINLATNSLFRREFLAICRLNKSDREISDTSNNSNRVFPTLRKLPSNTANG